MPKRPSRNALLAAVAATVVLSVIVLVLILRLPVVVGLGSRVKLPIFHGASTWVNIMLFALMGIAAIIYLVKRTDDAYAWEVGFRSIAMPLWAVNSALGFVAALSTWDFSGSTQSPLVVARSDPRLTAQFVILIAIGVVLMLDWLVHEKRIYKAVTDLVFVAIATAMLSDIFLDPAKRALHPDSPVLNSGWDIKLPFFAVVAAWFIVMLLGAWIVHGFVAPEAAAATEGGPGDEPISRV